MFLAFGYPRLTSAAHPVHVECEAILTEAFRRHILNSRDDLRRLHLRHLAAHRTDLMAMAVVIVTGLILRGSLKTVTDHQSQGHKQVQGVIERGPADVEIHVLNQFVAQLFQREMAMCAIHGPEDGIALKGLAMIVHLKIVIQYSLNGADYTFLVRNSHRWTVIFLKTAQRYIFSRRQKRVLSIKNLN